MQFKKIEDLRPGMRLARPIYNKNGVMLFDRDAKISAAGIASIQNFGLIGLFILEPAEPCPPMSEDDIEFERFQTVNVFGLMDEIEKIKNQGRTAKLSIIVSNIIKSYGHLERKINFNQNLRSEEDAKYKHAINVAILTAMMSNKLNLKVEDRLDAVTAALVRGLVNIDTIEKLFSSNPNVKRYVFQADTILQGVEDGAIEANVKLMDGGKILAIADVFDSMTCMSADKTPDSEVATIKYMLDKPGFFDKNFVMSIVESINILVPGICVELNTGSKALVISENKRDMFRPMILSFDNNEIIDLSNTNSYGDVEIIDIMKTMDNRHVMDTEMLKNFGL
ncbi:MAG: phosphohydrolase [Lachnospiraceae bacterium]|nr:phosphohydrolase [Lachnospiraceae bacterium]